MIESQEQRDDILKRMKVASSNFYLAAVSAGCHAFIEFTGLMNEFIKVCKEADDAGIDWLHANVHGDIHLPFQSHHIKYLSEKIECIYGRRLADGDDEKKGFQAAMDIVKRCRQGYFESCQTRPEAFCVLDQVVLLLEAELGRMEAKND